MTHFTQLDYLHKQAAAAPGYKYQKTPSGLNNPYVPQVAKVAPQGLKNAVGWGVAELGADLALGSQAVTGVPWYLGKALYQGFKGNWGNAAANVAMAGTSLIPGAASSVSLAKGALTAGRIANTAGKVGRIASLANKYKGGIATAQQAAGAGLSTVKALPGASHVVGAYNAVASPVDKFVRGTGVTPGVEWTANVVPKLRAFTASTAGTVVKNAPLSYAGGKLPNNLNFLSPAAPPPAPTNPFSNYQIQSALAGNF